LLKAAAWFAANKLTLNVKKNNWILYSFQIPRPQWEGPIIGDARIKRIGDSWESTNCKFQGLRVSHNMTWVHHIRYLTGPLNSGCFALAWAKDHASCTTKLNIYCCLFKSHLLYAMVLWGSAKASLLDGIVTLQKRAIRHVVNGKYNSHTGPVFRKLSILMFLGQNQVKAMYSCLSQFCGRFA
jgi:hypothetical protein